jgi:UDP-glucose 4-epimerase
MAVARFMNALAAGEDIEIFGDGDQTRDFTFISDVVEATVRAATSAVDGIVLNVGGGSRATINQVLGALEAISRITVGRHFKPATAGDQRHSTASINLARRHLEWEPRVSLSDGLVMQWTWFHESTARDASLSVAV